jgi:hypothetical protein
MVKQDNYSITLAKSLLSLVRFYTCKNMDAFRFHARFEALPSLKSFAN